MRIALVVLLVSPLYSQSPQSPPRDRAEQEQTTKEENHASDRGPQPPPSPTTTITSGVDQPAPRDKEGETKQEAHQDLGESFLARTWSNWHWSSPPVLAGDIALKTLGAIKDSPALVGSD